MVCIRCPASDASRMRASVFAWHGTDYCEFGGAVQQQRAATEPTLRDCDRPPITTHPAASTATDLAAVSSHRGKSPARERIALDTLKAANP